MRKILSPVERGPLSDDSNDYRNKPKGEQVPTKQQRENEFTDISEERHSDQRSPSKTIKDPAWSVLRGSSTNKQHLQEAGKINLTIS